MGLRGPRRRSDAQIFEKLKLFCSAEWLASCVGVAKILKSYG